MFSSNTFLYSFIVYIGSLVLVLYFALFIYLPKTKMATSDINTFMAEYVSDRRVSISYGDSSNWKFIREKTIEIQGDRCLCCGDRPESIHVDHIKPKSRYPHLEFMIDNLQVLCPKCNRDKSFTEETDYRKSNHLISLLREVYDSKLLQRRYVYNVETLQSLAAKRFHAELKNKSYKQVSPIS